MIGGQTLKAVEVPPCAEPLKVDVDVAVIVAACGIGLPEMSPPTPWVLFCCGAYELIVVVVATVPAGV